MVVILGIMVGCSTKYGRIIDGPFTIIYRGVCEHTPTILQL